MISTFLLPIFVFVILLKSTFELNDVRFEHLMSLTCNTPVITLHVFSGTENPTWSININQLQTLKNIANQNSIIPSSITSRIMGYQGFSIMCSLIDRVFINGRADIELYLLSTGRHHLSSSIIEHVQAHVGEIIPQGEIDSAFEPNVDCNKVPIRGTDGVPVYDPKTDDGGCFVQKQTLNNCYAYGTDIVTNTFPQPGRGSGKKWLANTCKEMGAASVRDNLIFNGTKLPNNQPKEGHYVALLIWPDTNFHWIRKDANGYWSHKPGGTPVTNVDNTGTKITDPSKSDFAPWTQFCAYYIAKPSNLTIN